jgi:hypothetical protein
MDLAFDFAWLGRSPVVGARGDELVKWNRRDWISRRRREETATAWLAWTRNDGKRVQIDGEGSLCRVSLLVILLLMLLVVSTPCSGRRGAARGHDNDLYEAELPVVRAATVGETDGEEAARQRNLTRE